MEFIMVIWREIAQLPNIVYLAVVFLLVFGGHWFPWHIIPGATDEQGLLKSTLRYVFGCCCIFIGPLLFTVEKPDANAATATVFFALSNVMGGLGAVVPRLVRKIAKAQRLEAENVRWQEAVDG